MSITQGRRGARRFKVHPKASWTHQPSVRCACEPIESRLLLSAAIFAAPKSVSVTGAVAPLVAANFSGLGKPIDLAVATSSAVQILTGNPDGSFSVGGAVPLSPGFPAQAPFLYGDFSGTGTQDIVLEFTSALIYKNNNGSGTFTNGNITFLPGGNGFNPLSGMAGDLNGDHRADLAIVSKPDTGSQLELDIFISNGDGTFTQSPAIPIVSSNAAGTISNEQVLTGIANEVVVYDGSSGNLDAFKGPGNGTFTQQTPVALTASLLSVATIAGKGDLVAANGNQVSLLVNQGDGTFQPDAQGPITLGGSVSALSTGDFNLDGTPDIITNQGILFGNGDGTFNTTPQALPVTINGGNGFSGTLQAADILGDGKPGFVGFAAAGGAIVSAVNQTPAPVSIQLQSSDNPAHQGADVQFTATVSAIDSSITATPTGTVTFFDGSTSLGSKSLVNGTATFDAGSGMSQGAHAITAQYSGDAGFAIGTSSPLTQIVTAPNPATVTAVVSSENPSPLGDDVILTAMVSGNDGAGDVPTGNVEFFDNGTALGAGVLNSAGSATFDTAGSLVAGSHSITARYEGDSNFAPSLSIALTQTVTPPAIVPLVTATTLPASIVAGAPTHGTISVSFTNETSNKISATKITVFASVNGAVANAIPLVSKTAGRGIALKAGQTRTLKLAVKSLPASIANGAYKLLAQVSNSLGQNSSSVNGPSVTVAAPFVHLAGAGGTGIISPNPVKAGAFVTLTLALTNSGNITSGAAALNIGLSTDGQTESTVIESPNANIRIKPGRTGVLRIRFKIPATVAAGSYKPFVSITYAGDVTTIIGQTFMVGT